MAANALVDFCLGQITSAHGKCFGIDFKRGGEWREDDLL